MNLPVKFDRRLMLSIKKAVTVMNIKRHTEQQNIPVHSRTQHEKRLTDAR